MAKKEKEKDNTDSADGIRYYWCVNCGNTGDFGFRRQRNAQCQKCKYDALTPYELDEILASEHLKMKFSDLIAV